MARMIPSLSPVNQKTNTNLTKRQLNLRSGVIPACSWMTRPWPNSLKSGPTVDYTARTLFQTATFSSSSPRRRQNKTGLDNPTPDKTSVEGVITSIQPKPKECENECRVRGLLVVCTLAQCTLQICPGDVQDDADLLLRNTSDEIGRPHQLRCKKGILDRPLQLFSRFVQLIP